MTPDVDAMSDAELATLIDKAKTSPSFSIADQLGSYATFLLAARKARRMGRIGLAVSCEAHADIVYSKLPAWERWKP